MVRSLFWKEWMEQRWWLLLGCFLMVGFTTVGLQARVIEDAMVMLVAAIIGAVVLPIVIAMGLVAPEREGGTMPTLLRLPARPVLAFAAKTAVGALAVAVPLLAAGVVAWLIAGGREIPSMSILRRFVQCVPVAVAVLIWTTVLGIRQPSEARVGIVGVAFLLTCTVVTVALARLTVFPLWSGGGIEVVDWMLSIVPVRLVQPVGPDGAWTITLYGWSTAQLVFALVVWLIGARLFRQPGRTRG